MFVRKGVGLVLLSLACCSALTCYEVCWCSCGSSLALLLRLCVVCVWQQSIVCELCGGVVALQLRQSPARLSCASLASVLLHCCCVCVVALLLCLSSCVNLLLPSRALLSLALVSLALLRVPVICRAHP